MSTSTGGFQLCYLSQGHHPLVPVPRWRMPWVLPWKHGIPRNCVRRCVVVLWCHWVVGWLWFMWCPTSSDELHDTMPEKYLCGRSTQDLQPSANRKFFICIESQIWWELISSLLEIVYYMWFHCTFHLKWLLLGWHGVYLIGFTSSHRLQATRPGE